MRCAFLNLLFPALEFFDQSKMIIKHKENKDSHYPKQTVWLHISSVVLLFADILSFSAGQLGYLNIYEQAGAELGQAQFQLS